MTSEPEYNPSGQWCGEVFDAFVEAVLWMAELDDVDLTDVDATEAREMIDGLIGGADAGLWRILHKYKKHAAQIGHDLALSWADTGAGFVDNTGKPYTEDDAEILHMSADGIGRAYGEPFVSTDDDGTVRITVPGIEEWRRSCAAREQVLEMRGEG